MVTDANFSMFILHTLLFITSMLGTLHAGIQPGARAHSSVQNRKNTNIKRRNLFTTTKNTGEAPHKRKQYTAQNLALNQVPQHFRYDLTANSFFLQPLPKIHFYLSLYSILKIRKSIAVKWMVNSHIEENPAYDGCLEHSMAAVAEYPSWLDHGYFISLMFYLGNCDVVTFWSFQQWNMGPVNSNISFFFHWHGGVGDTKIKW